MTPLTKCPGCQGPLEITNYNEGYRKEVCQSKCDLNYERFGIANFTSNGYIKFTLKDFYVWVYLDYFEVQDKIKIFHKRGVSTDAAFIIPIFKIDWDKLDYYNERWKSWIVFA